MRQWNERTVVNDACWTKKHDYEVWKLFSAQQEKKLYENGTIEFHLKCVCWSHSKNGEFKVFSVSPSFSYNEKKIQAVFFSCNLQENCVFSKLYALFLEVRWWPLVAYAALFVPNLMWLSQKRTKHWRFRWIFFLCKKEGKKLEHIWVFSVTFRYLSYCWIEKGKKNRIQWPNRVMLIFFSIFQSKLKTHKSKFNTQSHKSYFLLLKK